MALGVIGIGLTALMALMPTGLTIFRDSLESSARADILRKLSTEFQQSPFLAVKSSQADRYFTDQGTEITEPANYQRDGAFAVSYKVADSTDLLKGSGNSYPNMALKAVQVSIFRRADLARNPRKASFETTLFIPNTGL